MITKHPIYQDFPEYADKIKNLYHHNDEFQVLLHSYTELDTKIYKRTTAGSKNIKCYNLKAKISHERG